MTSALESEQADLVELLRGLSPPQWELPSLCVGWTVRDVVAHLIAWDEMLAFPGPLQYPFAAMSVSRRFLAARLSTDRLNARLLAQMSGADKGALIGRLEQLRSQPHRLFDRITPNAQLAEYVVHQQDIRRGLGLPRAIPDQRLRRALDGVGRLPGVAAAKRTRGLRLQATDLDWSSGDGAEVRGPGEALLLAIAGRPAALEDLAGPGRPTIAERLASQ